MPRSVQDIIDHGDELADRFEAAEPNPANADAHRAMLALRDAALTRSKTEQDIVAAVTAARQAGASWAAIGPLLGTSGEAARQRYGATTTNASRHG